MSVVVVVCHPTGTSKLFEQSRGIATALAKPERKETAESLVSKKSTNQLEFKKTVVERVQVVVVVSSHIVASSSL